MGGASPGPLIGRAPSPSTSKPPWLIIGADAGVSFKSRGRQVRETGLKS
jgi:hypothetical protein